MRVSWHSRLRSALIGFCLESLREVEETGCNDTNEHTNKRQVGHQVEKETPIARFRVAVLAGQHPGCEDGDECSGCEKGQGY